MDPRRHLERKIMSKVLVVDDKEESLYILQCLLSANGFTVTTASNGKEALDCAAQVLPDLVISDILMPTMDGFTLCRQWKQDPRFKSVPFIFYTATYTDIKDEEFALNLGADLFIVKPKDPDELMKIIRDLMEKQRNGELHCRGTVLTEESTYLQRYSQALVRKLENKVVELEEANRALAIKDFAIATSIAGIVFIDLSATITYVNQSLASMWGYECSELAGKPLEALAADSNAAPIIEMLRVNGHWIGELQAKRKDGIPFIAQVAAHTVTGPNGAPICFMASYMDITETKHLQEELRRSQNLEALSTFAAGIAHDFNNLLTGMFNSLDLAREQLPPDSPAQRQFAIAISVFERARDLTQNLLTFAKGGSPVRRAVNVSNIIRESCALSLSGSSIRHEFDADENLSLVEANANQLSQVFTNIILNARQAMGDNGVLSISAGNCKLKAGQMGTLPEGNYVVIRFEDNGPGIPEKVIPKIFDPFFSTKQKGSGLGLATSYSIIKNHGGHIQATSRAGAGANFEIWLPARIDEILEKSAGADFKTVTGFGRILIMDDEESIRSVAEAMLTRAGYEVTSTADGREALNIYRKALSVQNPFDLVILDLTVRGGVGGEETLTELLEIDPRAVALASSGYSHAGALSQLKQSGFAGVLPKPYSRHELLSVVKATISQTQGTD
jgi:two-component system, cell cycle sensor histidine kinase and response regulator CckA